MIFNILLLIASAIGYGMAGWKGALLLPLAVFFWFLSLSLMREMFRMIKYRDEYRACTNAVLANSEAMADEVNRWSVNYYVHKSFRMSASRDGLECGYKLSVRDRPRSTDWGGGGGDIGFVVF